MPSVPKIKPVRVHGAKTESAATSLLLKLNSEFRAPTASQKKKLLIAFARKNKVLYGRAYDVIRISGPEPINLDDEEDIKKNFDRITIYEIKSTTRKLDKAFKGYFFALTTAELLVAQNLKEKYRFIFVNINTEHTLEQSLQEVMNRATGLYPQWSISF